MNFLRQSFSSISEAPLPPSNSNPPQQHSIAATHLESDRDASLRAAATATPPLPPAVQASSFDSDGEDARLAPISSVSAVDSLRTRNRIAIEDHMDVPEEGGGILIPSRELPTSWYEYGDMTSVMNMDRAFVFPGECVSIVVYVSSHDPSMPEIITPFRVAAMLEKVNLTVKESCKNGSSSASEESLEASLEADQKHLTAGKVELSSLKKGLSVGGKVFMIEEHKNRIAALLHLFQNSHFFTKISETEEDVLKREKLFGQPAEELDDGTVSTNSSEHKKSTESAEPVPVIIEGGDFDPRNAGGVARNARCYSFDNGDIAVVLQVTVATDLKGDVVLEVLQFEQPGKVGTVYHHGNHMERTQVHQGYSNSSEQLLQWLLPLDNPPSPPLSSTAATPTSFINSSPQRPSLTSSSGSSLFSFANLRTYSSGSSLHSGQSASMATAPQLSSTHGLEEWERSASQRSAKGHSMGKEGLLSFRGAQLEPQRFSVHCGLEGLYVPGWRWRRKLEIVEPVAIESYIADCNTKDLICVTVENVVPDHIPEIIVIVDSISIVCQTPRSSSTASSIPIACVEVGENHKLPGLSLRPQEQHSFILKPSNSSSQASSNDKVKAASASTSHEMQPVKTSFHASSKQKVKDHGLGSFHDTGSYVIVVSCRCSHTESRLHFKHPIKWQPRTPPDLLLSVSLESASIPEISTGSLPTFVPKVVTVQATNLTLDSLHLTLLAPSSKYSGPSPSVPVVSTSGLSRISSFMSFHERKEWPIAKSKESVLERDKGTAEASPSGRPSSLQRSLSLPPAKPIESIMGITPRVVKERAISAVDIAAGNSSARTHLWLQSIVPLGYVPPQSTTAIRCELLPLTDGIITLDTLRISTKERDVYYPEQALQIYATSSIGIGIP